MLNIEIINESFICKIEGQTSGSPDSNRRRQLSKIADTYVITIMNEWVKENVN